MAKVFPGRELAHVWNSQSQDEGRNSNGQFYFVGSRLYSYGSHFLVGFIMPDGSVLMNDSTYSMTTAKHKGHAAGATGNRRRYYAPNLTALDYALRDVESGSKSHIRRQRATVREYLVKYSGELCEGSGEYIAGLFGLARSWPAIQREGERKRAKAKVESAKRDKVAALADAKQLAEMTAESFALYVPDERGRDIVSDEWRQPLPQFIKRVARAHKAASSAGQTRRKAILWERLKALRDFESAGFGGNTMRPDAQAIAAERERRRIEREREEAERRADWINGIGNGRFTDEAGGALLRIRGDLGDPDNAELETSHGARVPLMHAIKAFRFVKLIREKGGHWQRNGRTVRVGHYQLDSIDPDGFNAGCHRFNWPEIERVAKLAGVWNLPADDSAVQATLKESA
jgi:hypothetical protein